MAEQSLTCSGVECFILRDDFLRTVKHARRFLHEVIRTTYLHAMYLSSDDKYLDRCWYGRPTNSTCSHPWTTSRYNDRHEIKKPLLCLAAMPLTIFFSFHLWLTATIRRSSTMNGRPVWFVLIHIPWHILSPSFPLWCMLAGASPRV